MTISNPAQLQLDAWQAGYSDGLAGLPHNVGSWSYSYSTGYSQGRKDAREGNAKMQESIEVETHRRYLGLVKKLGDKTITEPERIEMMSLKIMLHSTYGKINNAKGK